MQSRLVSYAQFAGMATLLFCANVGASDLLIFPSITGVARNSSAHLQQKQEIEPALDMFFSMKRESFLLLAEFFVNRDEHELERLQFGIAPTPTDKIWLGRFHTPLSYWNTAYHHGVYLQPSITRPGIAEYEDGGGILPMHTTGLLLDGSRELDQNRWNYEIAAGIGPALTNMLTPFSLTEREKHGGLSISAKLGFQALDNDTNEMGVFGSYTEIPIYNSTFTQAKQILTGGFYDQQWGQWRIASELTLVHTRMETASQVSSSTFANLYIHGEYKISEKLAAYGRLESSANAHNAYLQMFPGFISARTLIGGRWEPLSKQAIKLEVSRNKRQDDHNYNELGVQWSMVFP